MPEQIIYSPNPPPDPSQIPDSVLELRKVLDYKGALKPEERHAIQQFRKAADFIAAGTSGSPMDFASMLTKRVQR